MLTLLVQELYSESQLRSCDLRVVRNNVRLTGLGVSHWFLALGKWPVTMFAYERHPQGPHSWCTLCSERWALSVFP